MRFFIGSIHSVYFSGSAEHTTLRKADDVKRYVQDITPKQWQVCCKAVVADCEGAMLRLLAQELDRYLNGRITRYDKSEFHFRVSHLETDVSGYLTLPLPGYDTGVMRSLTAFLNSKE